MEDHVVSRLALVFLLLLLAACTVTGDETPIPPTNTTAPPTAAPATDTAAPPTAAPATDVPATATTEAGPTATSGSGPTAALCPEIARPAVLLFIPGQDYVLVDPASGQSCDLVLPDPAPGLLEIANGELYYHAREGDNLTVKRLRADGTAEALAFTTTNAVEQAVYQDFAVSPDGRYIAWSAAGNKADEPSTIVSNLWVAEVATGAVTAHIEEFSRQGELPGAYALVPVRFSANGETLFYSRQPIGIGGSWIAFVGRYSDLFATPSTGGVLTPVFECAANDAPLLCLGDFAELDGQVTTLVYTKDQAKEITVLNGAGETLNTIVVDAEYVGYPTMSESGELAFYTATLGESFPNPAEATLSRVAPPTAPAEVAASDPNLLTPQGFLDGSRLVVGYVMSETTWGVAIVDVTTGVVTPLSQWPDATYVGVVR
jgi:hypothetical protein